MQLVTHHLTSSGGRAVNEDAVKLSVGPEYALLALADGLGGHGGGSLAANQSVATAAAAYAQTPALSDLALQALFKAADQAVAALRYERRQVASSMRTTLAVLAIRGGYARWAHVGDSRVYWYRDGALMQRTRDHSLSEMVMALPAGAPAEPLDEADRHVLLRALGSGRDCSAELGSITVALRPGDAFLLCTDGVWGALRDTEITDCLSHAATCLDWCKSLERRVLDRLADEREEHDNYSMIAAMVIS
jgi:serine/threonine protein phosphatase PrpC